MVINSPPPPLLPPFSPLSYTLLCITCTLLPNFSLPFHSLSLQDTEFENPVQRLSEEEQEEMGLQYYDSDVHKASFTLPRFARKVDTLMVAKHVHTVARYH